MRMHALESTGGLTYAEMGRFKSAANPDDPKGTNDEAAALMEGGAPVSNSARDIWVTETALSTALNVAFFAGRVALFSIVMGIALLLTGIGFLVLTFGGAMRRDETTAPKPAAAS
jgi:hypothetical protein